MGDSPLPLLSTGPLFTAKRSLRTEGGGAITVPNAKAYGLEPGISMPTGPDVYGISMFHQLHCLVRISDASHFLKPLHSPPLTPSRLQTFLRASYYAALNGSMPAFTQPGFEQLPKEKQEMLSYGHVYHCFDYLRQGIMCASDLTIESATDFPEKWLEGISEDMIREQYGDTKPVIIDGWGIKHQCRNFDEAWDWTFRNRVPDDSGVEL